MNKDARRKLRIGFFMLTGVILLGAALFFFGLSDLFVNKAEITTCFTESVQGLSAGSPVKFRGVPVGSVKKILIRVSDQVVEVDMEVDLKAFADLRDVGGFNRPAFRVFFNKQLKKGLRCRLELTGITGLRYIDLDYLAPEGSVPEPPAALKDDKAIYVPSMPSSLRDIMRGVVTSLDRISKIRFEEISQELERSLNGVSSLLSDPSLKSALERINEAAEQMEQASRHFNSTFTPQRMEALAAAFQRDLDTLHKLMLELEKNAREAKIPESSAAFRSAAGSAVSTGENLQNTLERLNRTLDAMTRLLDQLNDDPASVIHGRRKP